MAVAVCPRPPLLMSAMDVRRDPPAWWGLSARTTLMIRGAPGTRLPMTDDSNARPVRRNPPIAIGLGWILFCGWVLVLQGLVGPWVTFAVVAAPAVLYIAVRER
jgi:hypothetical protein